MTGRRVRLARVSVARFRRPITDPVNADFVANLDRVNAAADASDGFVWRLIGEGGDATDIRAFDDPHMIVNLSVWTGLQQPTAFTYGNKLHVDIMRRRKKWFEKLDVFLALWWVPAGHRPAVVEARERLDLLRRRGPTRDAFPFARPLDPSGTGRAGSALDRCA